jgi:hypothetical protein
VTLARPGRRVALALLMVTAGACAKDKVVTSTTTQTSIDYRREPGATVAGGPSTSLKGRSPRVGPYSAADPPSSGFRDADVLSPGPLPLTVRISPGCVEHGQTLDITARSRRGIYMRLSIVYPNGQFRDVPTHSATAGGAGTVTWSVKVTEEAKAGVGHLQVSARDPDKGESGTTGAWDFVVAAPHACS